MRKIGKLELVRPFVPDSTTPLVEARDSRLGRCVVLLATSLRGPEAARVVPFLDGAPKVAALRHPSIVPVHELGVDAGVPYVVMELPEGLPLLATRAWTSRSAEWKLRVVGQVCEALAHAHAQDVLHLGLSPAMVFVTPSGQASVLGFGLAPLLLEGIRPAAAAEFPYAGPELFEADSVGERADVFSAGALAHELFSGRPFAGVSTLAALPPSPYSPRLEAIVTKALARDPQDRHPRVTEMGRAFSDLVTNSADTFFERMLQADNPPQGTAPEPTRQAAGGATERNAGSGGPNDRVQTLYNMALSQAAEGRLEEASKLAKAIRRLAPDDPRNDEMTAYLLAEAETAVRKALARSPSGPRARALRQRLERLSVANRAAAGPFTRRSDSRSSV